MMNKPTLSERRAILVERCAEQRVGLAFELQALRPGSPGARRALAEHPLAGYILKHPKLVLGMAATALSLAVTRPKRLFGLLGSALSGWKVARKLLGMLAGARQ
jgi:hypothetical protein